MNVQIDINNIIDQLPEQAKRTVLYTLVGSLNARIIGSASRIVAFLDRNEVTVAEEILDKFQSVAQDAAARAENGTGHDTWKDLLHTAALSVNLRDQLAALTDDDTVLPLSGTLKFMTEGGIKMPSREVIEALVTALDVEGLDVTTIEQIYKLDIVRSRADMAAKSDRIMDVVFALPFNSGDGTDPFDHLSPTTQESIVRKLHEALNKSINNVVVGMLQKRGTAVLGDIPLIKAATQAVEAALASVPTATRNIRRIKAADAQTSERF